MGSNSYTTIEDIKSQLNIVDVISRCVPLKRAGANFKGVCPFHNEKTPSFVVSEQKQIFTCFGCGASGDVFEFTKRFYNLEFQEAIEKLCNENGIEYVSSFSSDNKALKDRVYEMNKLAARHFYDNLKKIPNPGYEYLKGRKLNESIMSKFGLGYALDSWDDLFTYMKDQGFTEKELVDFSLLRPGKDKNKPYDFFRNRVIFPLFNSTGKVVGFQSRKINPEDPSAKYINTVDNVVFHKKDTIFGLNLSKQYIAKEGYAILVEGNMDVISLYQAGIMNVGASCGTALNENQAKLLKRYCNTIVLCYDSDVAGQEADLRAIEVLNKAGLKVKVMSVPSGKDPDEYIKEYGKDKFIQLIEKSISSTEFKLNFAKREFDITKDDDKIDYVKQCVNILSKETPTVRDIYIKKLAKELGISEGAIKFEIDGNVSQSQITPNTSTNSDNKPENLTKLELTILSTLFINPSLTDKLISFENIFESGFGNKIKNIIFELYGTKGSFNDTDIYDRLEVSESDLLKNSLNSIVIKGNEEQIFNECIKDWRYKKAKLKEKSLIDKLSLIDESNDNSEYIKQLNDELLDVINEIKSLGGLK